MAYSQITTADPLTTASFREDDGKTVVLPVLVWAMRSVQGSSSGGNKPQDEIIGLIALAGAIDLRAVDDASMPGVFLGYDFVEPSQHGSFYSAPDA